MTIEERIKELVQHGAALQVYFPQKQARVFILGALVLVPGNPPAFKWCAIYPEDQHHIHTTIYTKVALAAGGRDVVFWDGNHLAACAVPIEESDVSGNPRGLFGEWQDTLNVPGNRQQFETFFKNN